MRVNMFGLRLTMDCHPRSKNGQPPHNTTGVARISSSQITARADMTRPTGPLEIMSAMVRKRIGAARTALTQKRRDMSRSSRLSSPSRVTVRGSNAMPQIGHVPRPFRTISGCIGQVYSVPAGFLVAGVRGGPPSDGREYLAGSATNLSRHDALQKKNY